MSAHSSASNSLSEVNLNQTLRDFAELTENIQSAWLQGQSALAELITTKATNKTPQHLDPFNIAPAYADFLQSLIQNPEKFTKTTFKFWSDYTELWTRTVARSMGGTVEPLVTPEQGDKRFADKTWQENAVFDHLKQSYLLTNQWIQQTLDAVEDLPETERTKLQFFSQRFAETLSPTNYFATNPIVLRKTLETKGENLVRGVQNLITDLRRGDGNLWITQTNMNAFKVGENIAATPGEVIFENDVFQLIQYAPTTPKVQATPILITPPWINKYYILDLNAEKSMIRWLVTQGHTVFVISWVNPRAGDNAYDFNDYIHKGFLTALKEVLIETQEEKAHVVGYCIGGTLVSAALAHMAQQKDDRAASVTFFTTQTDFTLAGDLKAMIDDTTVNILAEATEQEGGILGARHMAQAFNLMRGTELIWNFVVSNYYLGEEPSNFDMLYWNADATRMPGKVHIGYLRDFYIRNKLSEGNYHVAGKPVSLKDITIPIYSVATKDDHIAPAASVYRGAKLFGSTPHFVVAGSGHIAGIVNSPAKNKYRYWSIHETQQNTATAWPESLDGWLENARETPGSWWPNWHQWLLELRNEERPARDAGAVHGSLEPAPGRYVKSRSDI